ncbi:MAG: RAMP superfamily CRISPR-associated protein, partial [Cetobacterium sp.]
MAKGKIERFSYPYNFVTIDENVEREPFKKGDLTGKIICTLKNRSPIFFPEPKVDTKISGHSKEMFYKRDGNYIIPGSSLKGSFRSVLETISNSCFINIESERLEKRLSAGAFNDRIFGIIKRVPTEIEDGLIVEAVVVKTKKEALSYSYEGKEGVYEISLSNLIKNYEKIETKSDFNEVTSGKKDMDGVLWVSSSIGNKKHEKIMYPKQDGKTYKLSIQEYEDIKYLISQRNERELKTNAKDFYLDAPKSGDPIRFQKTGTGGAKNLAFSEIPRLRYKYSPYDLIPNGLKSCETIED